MKYTVKILVPKDTKKDFCMYFIKGQMMIHAKPHTTDIQEIEYGTLLIYKFDTTYQKYGKILRFVEMFNARMKHSSTTKLVKKLAIRKSATLVAEDERFFERPANVDIEEHPTVEELSEANATWKDKIKKISKRLGL